MAVTLTYDATLSRVRIDADGLAAADEATVERSTDQIRWTTVRGGTAVGVTAGAFDLTLDDYEFTPNVVNYYRVRGVETGAISYVSSGSTSSGADGSRAPGMPASIVQGDLLCVLASTRNSGTGTVDTPANYSVMKTSGNFSLLGKIYDGVESAPTITFTGGAVNETTMAVMFAFRRAALTPVTSAEQLNASAQGVAWPALAIPADDMLVVRAGWKQDDHSSVVANSGWTEACDFSTTLGNDAMMVCDFQVQTDATDIAVGSYNVVGGASAISRALILALEHAAFLNEQSGSITPTLDSVWLKSVPRPFLNQTIELGGEAMPFTRAPRGGVFEVVGRSLPVAVSDVMGSRRFPLTLRAESAEDADDLELLLASGDILFLHAPPDEECPIPSGAYLLTAGEVTRLKPMPGDDVEYIDLTVRQVAPPGPDVVSAAVTWQTVLNQYATWADLIADKATWADVLTLVGDPSEVIVP